MRNIISELILLIAGIIVAVLVTITVGTSLVGVGNQFGTQAQNVFSTSSS